MMILLEKDTSMNHEFFCAWNAFVVKRSLRHLLSTNAGSMLCFERLNEKVKTQSKQSTRCCEIEDVEGVKRIAPPPTAHTDGRTGSPAGAVCSLWYSI